MGDFGVFGVQDRYLSGAVDDYCFGERRGGGEAVGVAAHDGGKRGLAANFLRGGTGAGDEVDAAGVVAGAGGQAVPWAAASDDCGVWAGRVDYGVPGR